MDFLRLYNGTPIWELACATTLALAAGAPLPVLSLVTGKIVDSFGSNDGAVVQKVWLMIIVAACFYLLSWGYMVLFAHIGMMNGVRLRSRYLRSVLHADVEHVEGRKLEVTTTLGPQIDTISSAAGEKAGLLIQSIAYFISAFAVSFSQGPQLTATLLPLLPCLAAIVYIGNRYNAKLSARLEAVELAARRFSQDCFANVRLLKACGLEDEFAERFGERLHATVGTAFRKAFVGAAMMGSTFFVIYCTNALAFWRGSQLIVDLRQSGAGSTYVVITLVLDSSFVIGMVSPFLQLFASAGALGATIRAEEKRISVSRFEAGGKPLPQDEKGLSISFDHVSLAYKDKPALDDLSLTIEAGSFVGLCGPSGSGKSSLFNLVERFEDPQTGRVLLGGHELRSLDKTSVRKAISIVAQDNLLLSGTVQDNIALGLVKAGGSGVDHIREAARVAEVLSFDPTMQLPIGTSLSLGQRQRVALARALVSQPRVLLLDEATSALDGATERRVMDNLRAWASARSITILCIAHRLDTIRHADRIFFIERGKCIEQGIHNDLMDSKGRYAQLYLTHDPEDFDDIRKASVVSSSTSFTEVEKFETTIEEEVIIPVALSWRHLMDKSAFRWSLVGFVIAAVVGGIPTADALLFGNLISTLNGLARDSSLLPRSAFLAAFFVLVAGTALLGYTGTGVSFAMSNTKLSHALQRRLFRHWLGGSMGFHATTTADALSTRLQTDAAGIAGLSGQFIGTTLSVFVSIVSGVVLAHAIAWKIALVFLPAVPMIMLAGFLRLKVAARNQERTATAFADSLATAAEAVADIRGVAAYALEGHVQRQFDANLSHTHRDTTRFLLTSTSLLALAYSLPFVIYALAYLWGSHLVSTGTYSTKDFFIVLPALLFSAQTSGQVFSMAPDFSRAKRAAQSIRAALSTDSENVEIGNPAAPAGSIVSDSALELRNVSFTYPETNEPVLRDVTFKVPRGSRVALVGASGCGKSTLFNLLQRFIEPSRGQITIDGQDTSSMSLKALRSLTAIVPQEPKLFADTLRFNLALGVDVPDSDLFDALAKAHLLDHVRDNLPMGLDTLLTNTSLSGGQRQRLALARALVTGSKARIMLLDEPTSALDLETERQIDQTLALLATHQNLTQVQIAHRESAIARADLVVFLTAGTIRATGTHQALMRDVQEYRELIRGTGVTEVSSS
ncbi:hypothetical protein PYCC9005_004787 [Savitreella phatthalungensis]